VAGFRLEPGAGLPPFQGGAAGLLGYDLCHHLERLPRPRFDEFAVPDLAVAIYDWVLSFDHVAKRAWLVATGYPESETRERRRRARKRLREIRRRLQRPVVGTLRVPLRQAGAAAPAVRPPPPP